MRYLSLLTLLIFFTGCVFYGKEKAQSTSLGEAIQQKNNQFVKNNTSSRGRWLQKWRALANGQDTVFRIVQLGDSHTAGDFFTDTVRHRLQQKFGNAGIGWVYPTQVSGQRQARVSYESDDWSTMTSRRKTRATSVNFDFPLGGIIAINDGAGQTRITSRRLASERHQVTFTLKPIAAKQALKITDDSGQQTLMKPPFSTSEWQYESISTTLPFSFSAAEEDRWQLGYLNIENNKPGVILSAFGINGARLSETHKWRTHWFQDLAKTQADLVILSYGTNEAFNDRLNSQETRILWRDTIRRIKQTLPYAGILIIGAPESLIGVKRKKLPEEREHRCGIRPPSLDMMQTIQRDVADAENVLYWSWEDAMGGKCSMRTYMDSELARKDGIHFTAEGYETAAEKLASYLIDLAK